MTDYNQAACLDTPQEMFFPEPGKGGRVDYDAAKQVCAGCPIRLECRLEHRHERFGVWGGTTPEERGYTRHGHHIAVARPPRPGSIRHAVHQAIRRRHLDEFTVAEIKQLLDPVPPDSIASCIARMVDNGELQLLDRRRGRYRATLPAAA